MGEELDLPGELYGFGSLLLWLLATRATQIVDACFTVGPARPSPRYGVVDGHHVPTPSVVAWLLTAAEFGLPVEGLMRQQDPGVSRRQHVLARTISSAWNEAHALAGLGRCAQAAHRIADARAFLHQAHDVFDTIDPEEATHIATELAALPAAPSLPDAAGVPGVPAVPSLPDAPGLPGATGVPGPEIGS